MTKSSYVQLQDIRFFPIVFDCATIDPRNSVGTGRENGQQNLPEDIARFRGKKSISVEIQRYPFWG